MSAPLYSIPGATAPPPAAPADRPAVAVQSATDARTVNDVLAQSQVGAVMDELERDLVGLEPVKSRIRDIAALLVARRIQQAHFANARSVRNALDRARLRQASRLFAERDREFTPEDLSTIAESDIRASRVFQPAAAQKPV